MSLINELSTVESQEIRQLMQQIDLQNSQTIINYGIAIQKKTAKLVNETLQDTMGYNARDIKNLCLDISERIRKFDAKSGVGFLWNLLPRKHYMKLLRSKYKKTEKALELVRHGLAEQEVSLRVELKMLRSYHQQNQDNSEVLEQYIKAGRQKIAEVCTGELEQLQKEVQELQTQESALAQINLNDRVEALKERLGWLENTKIMATQLGVQLLAFRKADEILLQNVKSIANVSIPTWQQSVINILAINRVAEISYDDSQATVDIKALRDSNARLLEVVDKVIYETKK